MGTGLEANAPEQRVHVLDEPLAPVHPHAPAWIMQIGENDQARRLADGPDLDLRRRVGLDGDFVAFATGRPGLERTRRPPGIRQHGLVQRIEARAANPGERRIEVRLEAQTP